MKKLSQDNDSQSSGEEDDDDGFEILTAENLFSTLLQRVSLKWFSYTEIKPWLISPIPPLHISFTGACLDKSHER